jgi:hypothetical protein
MSKPQWMTQIYQEKGSKPGLTVKDGMLINNTSPYQSTTISQAVQANKMRKRAEKVSAIAEGMMMCDMMGRRY